MPTLPTPTELIQRAALRDRVADMFGVRLRVVAGIAAAGVGGGLVASAYLAALMLVNRALGPDAWPERAHLLVLGSVGIAITVIVRWAGRPADVELLVDSIHVPDGPRDTAARLRSLLPISLLCVGSGGTLGPEAPLVTTTGTLAHRQAGRAGLSPGDVRVLTITGMAAGFAVLFGAPLGGALFALEIPHRRGIGYHEAAVPACIGAILGYACSTATGRLGLEPIWHVPSVASVTWADMPWSLVAGAIGATVALLFTFATRLTTLACSYLPRVARPAIGGLALGAVALATPYVLTNGELQIDSLLTVTAAGTLLAAAAAKLAGAVICVATGWRGGFIIPLFFIGFCVGQATVHHLPGASHWPFVLAVMIATNVGVTKTPLGSTLVITEMSGSALLPGALIAALTALVLTSSLKVIESQRDRVDAYGPAHGH